MKNLTFIIAVLSILMLIGCLKTEFNSTVNSNSAPAVTTASKSEIKEIRQQLELVNLGLLTLLNDQQFTNLVSNQTASLKEVSTNALKIAYDSKGTSLQDVVYNGILKHTKGDTEQAEAVVQAFFSFEVAGTVYYPAITPIGNTDQLPEYIVNQEEPGSDLFYGYLANGDYTYMKTKHLTTLNGWVVSETTVNTANALITNQQATVTQYQL